MAICFLCLSSWSCDQFIFETILPSWIFKKYIMACFWSQLAGRQGSQDSTFIIYPFILINLCIPYVPCSAWNGASEAKPVFNLWHSNNCLWQRMTSKCTHFPPTGKINDKSCFFKRWCFSLFLRWTFSLKKKKSKDYKPQKQKAKKWTCGCRTRLSYNTNVSGVFFLKGRTNWFMINLELVFLLQLLLSRLPSDWEWGYSEACHFQFATQRLHYQHWKILP